MSIIFIFFRKIADLQDEQLLSGNNDSNTDLLQLADTINFLDPKEYENMDLFTMWFNGMSVPTSSRSKEWLYEEGISDIEKAQRYKRYWYRNDYCTFSRSFIIPIIDRITDSINGFHLCIDKTKPEILREAAKYLHKFLFKGRISFTLNKAIPKQLPTPKQLYDRFKEYETTSATNKTYWENWGSEKHMDKKRKKNQHLGLSSKINDDEELPLVHR